MTRECNYQADPAALFTRIADLPWAVFLDSGTGDTDEQSKSDPARRYHLLSALPVATLVSHGPTTRIDHGDSQQHSDRDPLLLLRELLERYRPANPTPSELPFNGGALGWLGYEFGAALEQITPHPTPPTMPDIAIGIYQWALLMDHQQRRGWLVGEPPAEVLARLAAPEHPAIEPAGFQLQGELETDLDRTGYQTAFGRIKHYLREGDCYQVNLARRFQARVSGDPWAAYLALRQRSPAPYGAYLSTPFGQVLCNSPEQFLRVDGDQISTRPIKGTRPRHPDPAQDQRLAEELQNSAKDRAENVMIVDLLRNDLGRVCRPGSIRVDGLWSLHSYATVHHLVSTVRGQLDADSDALALLSAAFPGGSITGAPKHRAMQIIRELEPQPRGVYCGSIGWLDWHGDMDSNIAIRTLVHQQGHIQFHAGGGIVIDSELEQEYQETEDKAAAMFALLGISSQSL